MKILLMLGLVSLHAVAATVGVIDPAMGFSPLRAEASGTAKIVRRIKSFEPFEFETQEGSDWCKVTLGGGLTGWVDGHDILIHFDANHLPRNSKDESEVEQLARGHGFSYGVTAQNAVRGDDIAMRRFFGLTDADGGAAEAHQPVLAAVFHLVGDERFASFLSKQPLDYQLESRTQIVTGGVSGPFPGIKYLRQHFPLTSAIFFRNEIVGWYSPDEQYAIRKVFSSSDDLKSGKVKLAELIDRTNHKVVRVLTDDDEGAGHKREGKVLWVPTSNRFAYYSANEFTSHVTVYQKSDEGFVRVNLPVNQLPAGEADTKIEGAKNGRQFIEPLGWVTSNIFSLMRYDSFETRDSSGLLRSTFRQYEMSFEIQPDGKATIENVSRVE